MALGQEIDQLTAGGLYKQARRMINEQIVMVSDDPAAGGARTGG